MAIALPLSVARDIRRSPRLGHTRAGQGEPMEALRKHVIGQGRHGRRCVACSLQFGVWDGFELWHIDGDHSNDQADNLAPICKLCHWPLHLDLVQREYASDPGAIIYLPELQQFELNQLLYAIGAYEHQSGEEDGPKERKGWNLYARLLARAQVVEGGEGSAVRPGLSKLHAMVRLLQDVKDERYAQRESWLEGCRYLPPMFQVVKEAEQLRKHGAAFAHLPYSSWPAIIEGRA